MKTKKSLIIFSLLMLMMGLFPGSTLAKTNKKHTDKVAPPADFLIQPELPKDNIGGKNLGYFNLKNSDKPRIITIKIFNTTQLPLKIETELKNATTLKNGVIDYNGKQSIDRKILKNPGTNYLTTAKSITVPAQQESLVKVKIKPTDFKGTKATAINLIGTPENQKGTITNKYIYAIGIILNGKSIKKSGLHKLQIKKATLSEDSNAINVKLTNPDAVYLMKNNIDISFHSAKWLVFQYHKQRKQMKVAPNSSFDCTIPFNGQRLVPGAYRLEYKVKNDKYKQEINKYVEITNNDIRFINKREYDLVRRKSWLIISATILILTVMTTYLIYYRRKKKNEELS